MFYVVSDADASFRALSTFCGLSLLLCFVGKKYVVMCGLRNLDRGRSPYVLFLSNCLRCRKVYSCRNIDKTVFLGKSNSSTYLLFQIVLLIFIVAMFKSEEKARCGQPQWLPIPRNDTASFLLEVVPCSVSVLFCVFFHALLTPRAKRYLHYPQSYLSYISHFKA